MSNDSSQAVTVQNLRFSWPNNHFGLSIDQFDIPEGAHAFLYGPSGSGKTTFLNLIAGVLKPQKGRIEISGTNICELSASQRDRFRARHMGVVFQQLNLIPFLSVRDNICLPLRFSRQKPEEGVLHERMVSLLDALGLDREYLQRRADELSVGQQQRVALARGLMNKPSLLIADEPTSALDQDNRDAFIRLMHQVASETNCTVLFVSHDRTLQSHFSHCFDMDEICHTEVAA